MVDCLQKHLYHLRFCIAPAFGSSLTFGKPPQTGAGGLPTSMLPTFGAIPASTAPPQTTEITCKIRSMSKQIT